MTQRKKNHVVNDANQMLLGDWLSSAPFTLSLSSGFFGFFAHAGVLARLESEGLMPSKLTGASAGALVGGCWVAGIDADTMRKELFCLKRSDFWDPSLGFGLLRGEKFDRYLRRLLGDNITFSKGRSPLAISAYDLGFRRTTVLWHGDLCSAIRASCALPLMFQPVRREGRVLLDGGIADRPGLAGTMEGERVLYHHLRPRRSWRRLTPKGVSIPHRQALQVLDFGSLPVVGPTTLIKGRDAFHKAYELAGHALTQPIIAKVYEQEEKT